MNRLMACFFPSSSSSVVVQEEEDPIVQFIEEAARTTAEVSDQDLIDLVQSYFPEFVLSADGEALMTRVARYRADCINDQLGSENTTAVLEVSQDDDDHDAAEDDIPHATRDEDHHSPDLVMLREACGLSTHADDSILEYIISALSENHNANSAMQWICEHSLQEAKDKYRAAQERERLQRQNDREAEKRARERVLMKFDEQMEEQQSGQHRLRQKKKPSSSSKSSDSESKIRFLDGKIVNTKGAKYIEIATKPEWDGGSRGIVKTKGKRGPGFVPG